MNSGHTEHYVIEKFDGTDFGIWKFRLTLFLRQKGLEDIAKGTTVKPTDEARLTEWIKKDLQAQTVISQSVDKTVVIHLMECKTAAEMINYLESIYEVKSETSIMVLLDKWSKYEMNPQDSMSTHISKVRYLAGQLKQVGENLSEISICMKMLYSLPDAYESAKSSWYTMPTERQTVAELSKYLMVEDARKNKMESKESVALLGKTSKKFKTSEHGNSTKNESNKPLSIQEKKRKYPCKICKRKGHWANECRYKNERQTGNNGTVAFTTVTYSLFKGEANNPDLWIADSGAGQHISFRSDWMEDYVYLPEKSVGVKGIGGKVEYAVGRGTVRMISQIGDRKINVDISNVLHVPATKVNVFSVKQAVARADVTVLFNRVKQCVIVDQEGNELVHGFHIQDDVYGLKLKRPETAAFISKSSRSHSKPTIQKWHERLGHVGKECLRNMAKNGSVIGLEFVDKEEFCEPCAIAKNPRDSFKLSKNSHSSKPCDLFTMDLCSSSPSVSLAKY